MSCCSFEPLQLKKKMVQGGDCAWARVWLYQYVDTHMHAGQVLIITSNYINIRAAGADLAPITAAQMNDSAPVKLCTGTV